MQIDHSRQRHKSIVLNNIGWGFPASRGPSSSSLSCYSLSKVLSLAHIVDACMCYLLVECPSLVTLK